MIFKITLALQDKQGHQLMPFNYHYPLSWAIHNIIRKSDEQFASFFHDFGYGSYRYKFKLFTFSDITIPFTSRGDRMLLVGTIGTFRICFHVPEAADHFLKGLFINQQIIIGDNSSQVIFRIKGIENCLLNLSASPNDIISVVVQPMSPLVVGRRRKEKSASRLYFSPYEIPFVDWLIFSWIQKYKAISSETDFEIEQLRKQIKVKIIFFDTAPAERSIVIKAGNHDAQKIRGYTKFRMRLTAPKKMIDLALNSGLGIKNSIGMGCVQLID
ncbi:MAG TPA: CRISPR-associated endoribonuclease Cas6 [Methylomirabilota bacterium]|nr:CRISPR-associated endoribonuclease Cas6 [Methylomirabilota bacterium]